MDQDPSLVEWRKAAELAPDAPRFAYAYAIGLHSAGRKPESMAVLRSAYEKNPFDAELLSALVTSSLELGRREDALEYAE